MRTVSVRARSAASAPENSPPPQRLKTQFSPWRPRPRKTGLTTTPARRGQGPLRGRRRGRADALRSDQRPDHGSPTPRDASERVHGFSTRVPARDRRVVCGSAAARLDCGRVFSRPGARVDEPRFTLSDVARRVATPTTMITTGLLSESRRGRAGGGGGGGSHQAVHVARSVRGCPLGWKKQKLPSRPSCGGVALPRRCPVRSGARARSLP